MSFHLKILTLLGSGLTSVVPHNVIHRFFFLSNEAPEEINLKDMCEVNHTPFLLKTIWFGLTKENVILFYRSCFQFATLKVAILRLLVHIFTIRENIFLPFSSAATLLRDIYITKCHVGVSSQMQPHYMHIFSKGEHIMLKWSFSYRPVSCISTDFSSSLRFCLDDISISDVATGAVGDDLITTQVRNV